MEDRINIHPLQTERSCSLYIVPLMGELRLSLFYFRTPEDHFVYETPLEGHLVHEKPFSCTKSQILPRIVRCGHERSQRNHVSASGTKIGQRARAGTAAWKATKPSRQLLPKATARTVQAFETYSRSGVSPGISHATEKPPR